MKTTKGALRSHFLTQRRALPTTDADRRSSAIANQFLLESSIIERLTISSEHSSPVIIHTFLPILRQHEVNTWPIIHRLWQEYPQVRVAVAVTNTVTRQLIHYSLTPETTLVENRWGIPEPIVTNEVPIPSGDLDIVLVPLLTFDRQGHRVGYGGGFYDRFLAECRPDCMKIGLSFLDPIKQISDVDSTDVRLNRCITPTTIYSFK